MRSEDVIQDRIRDLLSADLERRILEEAEPIPTSCVYNYRQTLDTRKEVNGKINENYNRLVPPDTALDPTALDPFDTRRQEATLTRKLPILQTIGLCMYGASNPGDWSGTICEDLIDAQECPFQAFESKISANKVREIFHQKIKDSEWLQENLPEVSNLLWAIDEGSEVANTFGAVSEPLTPEPPLVLAPSRPWWQTWSWPF